VYGLPAGIPALALGQTIYHEPTTPTRATRFSAALLGRMSDVAAREALGRRDNAARWIAELPGRATQAIPPVLAGGIAGYLRFPIHVPAGIAADLESSRYRRAGIARSYPKPLSELPAVAARMLGGEKRFPGAEQLARTLVTLPTHTRLTDRGREAILALASSWNGGIST
jgi:dTDP-4-amino-4,6-dideoxygalactose transaminase